VRKRGTIRSLLEEIPGIGKVRQKELLKFFGSTEKIKEATRQEFTQVPKMNSKSAQTVYRFFHPPSQGGPVD
jgi:excinuclease ABC subunit C